MVRSVGIAAILLELAWTGLAGAQLASPGATATPQPRYITVTEEGKQPERCKLLKTWRQANGAPAYQVQSVRSGELMTIAGTSPKGAGGDPREMSTRIFRWGRDNKPPAGAPVPPAGATQSAGTGMAAVSPAQPPVRRMPTAAPQPTRPSPVVKEQPSRPAPVATAAAPTPVPQTAPKQNSAPVAAPPRPTSAPYILTGNKPTPSGVAPSKPLSLTPMSTPMVQYSPAPTGPRPAGSGPDRSLTGTAQQPRLLPLAAGSAADPKPSNCACSQPCDNGCKPCNPCGQSTCVCGTPSPMRQPLISKLFKSSSTCNCNATAVTSQPAGVPTQSAGTNTATAAKPAAPAVVQAKTTTEPAKPVDWRQSWGKVEPWKGSAQANNTIKPVEVSRRVDTLPVHMEPAKRPDPLKDPAHYRDMVMNARLSNSKISHENPPPAVSPAKEHAPIQSVRTSAVVVPPPSHPALPLNGGQQLPEIMAHPAAAMNGGHQPPEMAAQMPPPEQPPSRVVVIRDDEPNAFWSPPQPPSAGQEKKSPNNAFDREPPPPPQGVSPANPGIYPNGPTSAPPVMPGIMQGPPPQGMVLKNAPRPPMAPYTTPGIPRPMSADTGVPGAMSNAFTMSATSRPIPADFGGTPQEPNGFDPLVQMGDGSPPRAYGPMPGAYRPPMPPGAPMPNMATRAGGPMAFNPLMNVPHGVPTQSMAMSATASAGASAQPASVPQLLASLKGSIRPSEREAAAEQLSELNWQVQPVVVEQLMKSARGDPAATVRAACVHALANMKVATPTAIALVRDLKSDRDPRVRQEADEALSVLGDSGIQQASHK